MTSNDSVFDKSSAELAKLSLYWADMAAQAEGRARIRRGEIAERIRNQRHLRLRGMSDEARRRVLDMMLRLETEGDGTPSNPGDRIWRVAIEDSQDCDRRAVRYAMAAQSMKMLEAVHVPQPRQGDAHARA